MQKHLMALLLVLIMHATFSAQTQKYSRVKIYTDKKGLADLSLSGVAIDHGEYKKDLYFISDFSADEIKIMRDKGYKLEIQIDDVAKHYEEQNNTASKAGEIQSLQVPQGSCNNAINFKTPVNFKLGSMGGFFTYTELLAEIDSMAVKYPNLISIKKQIGTLKTVEGRPLHWVRISNDPNNDQVGKPQILYDALHHAREPMSASQLIMFMWYLLENYNSNAEIKYLVDNTEMFFVPCVNPDGYVYNQSTNPNGGGMFRKNRKVNGGGTFGVDLNRNYSYKWGYDNMGSSTNSGADNYRGPSAFSEIETQLMKSFADAHQFKIAVNYHSYFNALIFPFDYGLNIASPDSDVFTNYSKLFIADNNFKYGTANQTVGYTGNGDSDDWMYGDVSSKPKIFSFSSEVGDIADGFWPAKTKIIQVCKTVLTQNLNAARLLLKYAVMKDEAPLIVTTKNGFLNYKIKNMGLAAPATFTVSIQPLGSNFSNAGTAKTYSALTMFQEKDDSISYSLNPSVQDGDLISYVIAVNNGSYIYRDTLSKTYGSTSIAFSSDCNSMNGWNSSSWNITTAQYHSPTASITDSPIGNYPDNAYTTITTSNSIDLSGTSHAQLSYWTKWDLEQSFDYVQVLASSDNGNTWSPLCGRYTRPGSGSEDRGNPLYDDAQKTWVKEYISLDDYVNKNISLRFVLKSDGGGNADGFYFDDLKVEKVSTLSSGINSIASSSTIFLGQNIPNPSPGNVTIPYHLPGNINGSDLFIYNELGEIVMQQKLGQDKTSTTVDLSTFNSGVYYYQLKTQSENSAVMRMVIVK